MVCWHFWKRGARWSVISSVAVAVAAVVEVVGMLHQQAVRQPISGLWQMSPPDGPVDLFQPKGRRDNLESRHDGSFRAFLCSGLKTIGDFLYKARCPKGGDVKELVLASQSARRARILRDLGLVFRIMIPTVEERDGGCSPPALVLENALRKWRWCREQESAAWIVAADTVVELEGEILGKPRDRLHAEEMLRAQSGRTQRVHTGYVIGAASEGETPGFRGVETSYVTFRALDEEEIRQYLDEVRPFDRAGSYDIDEQGARLIAGYQGSRTNVMGLPMERVRQWMALHWET